MFLLRVGGVLLGVTAIVVGVSTGNAPLAVGGGRLIAVAATPLIV